MSVPLFDRNHILQCYNVAVKPVKRLSLKFTVKAKRLARSDLFIRSFAVVSALILISTTLIWSYLSAHLHQTNADQLADPLLFGNAATFHGADFPAQHSFLLKWPIFYVIRVAGYSSASFILATMAITAVTIIVFAALLYRIDRRPLVFGTLCLALASCLLLIPAQPYPGGLLPVNMAMITTRNLEYILYIFGLIYVARQPKFTSWRFWVAVISLGLVSASDRLFLDISLSGAIIAMIIYAARQRWNLVSLSVNWLVISILAGIIALVGLSVLDHTHVAHIVSQSGVSPYAAVHSLKDALLAIGFAISGLFTNFGANPAYDATIVAHIPAQLYHRLISLSGISYLVNAAVLIYGLKICSNLLLSGLVKSRARTIKSSTALRLSAMLIWTSLAAFAVFGISKHDYAVDSRYLTISLFTVFIALATHASKKRLQPQRLLIVALLLIVSMLAAIPQLQHADRDQRQALAMINARNKLVARALGTHHTTTLVGDYWRVLPIKLADKHPGRLTPIPLGDCTTARTVLTSQAWQKDLHGHRFAYLLSLDKGLTDFPACNLDQITHVYGRPNATELIAGTLANPTELLLFYDQGITNSLRTTGSNVSTILPITLDELPHTACSMPTVMNIVAHEDDDILFMNPDIQQEISVGHCVRTIYITAGDDGQNRGYWLSREQGAEAAYSAMLGSTHPWVEHVVRLDNQQYVTIANPRGNNQISLIFMRLPDGGLNGNGFNVTHSQSLAALYAGKSKRVETVDKQSNFSSNQLSAALTTLMANYQPSTIHTQSSLHGTLYTDHSDHQAAGEFATRAYGAFMQQQFEGQTSLTLKYYVGYPVRQLPVNLTTEEIARKQAVFLNYAKHDGAVCRTASECDQTSTYGSYLKRQYQNPN
jgi:LmbE family N-acetylglucosaminyl deacetylase